MCGGILELLQGRVDLQCFCKGSCALRANIVPVESGGGEGNKSSAGRDSKGKVGGSVLDAGERLVDHEHVGDVLCAVDTEAVACDPANQGANAVSAAADAN